MKIQEYAIRSLRWQVWIEAERLEGLKANHEPLCSVPDGRCVLMGGARELLRMAIESARIGGAFYPEEL